MASDTSEDRRIIHDCIVTALADHGMRATASFKSDLIDAIILQLRTKSDQQLPPNS